MSRVLHLVALDEVVALNFPEAVEGIIIASVITAANQENVTIVRVLDALEIMREAARARIVDLLRRRDTGCFRVKVDTQDRARIFEEEAHGADGRTLLDVRSYLDAAKAATLSGCGHHGDIRLSFLWGSTGRATGLAIGTRLPLVSCFTPSLVLVRDQLIVRISLFAWPIAFEPEHLQNLRHNPVVWVHHVNLVADEAFELAARDLLLLGRETREACSATELLTMFAGEHIRGNHHARGTLKVARELVETEGLVVV